MKRHLKLLIISLCLVLIVGFAGLLVLIYNPGFFTGQIVDTINRELSPRTDFVFSIDEIDGNLTEGFVLSGVSLIDTVSTRRIEIEQMLVSYNFGDVIRGELLLKELKLVNPMIVYDVTSKGVSGDSGLIAPEYDAVRIDSFIVVGGELEIIEREYAYRLEHIDFTGFFGMDSNGIEVDVKTGAFSYPSRGIHVASLSGATRFFQGELSTEDLQFSALDCDVMVDGWMAVKGGVELHLDVMTEVKSFGEVLEFFDQDIPLDGNAKVSGKIGGSLSNLAFDLKAEGIAQDRDLEDLSIAGIYKGEKLEISSMSGMLSGASFNGNAVLSRGGVFSGELEFGDVDLSELKFSYLGTDFNGRVAFSGSGYTLEDLNISADVSLTSSNIRDVHVDFAEGMARISEKVLYIDTLRAVIAGSEVLTSGMIGFDRRLEVGMKINSEDVVGLANLIGFREVSGSLTSSFSLSGELGDPNLRGRIDLSELRGEDVEFESVTGGLLVERIMTKRDGTAHLLANNGAVTGIAVASLDMSARLMGDTLELKRLKAEEGANHLSMTGWMHGPERFGIDSLVAVYSEYALSNSSEIRVLRTGDVLELEPVVFKLNEGIVDLSAYWDKLSDSLDVSTLISGVQLKALSDAVKYKDEFDGLVNGSVLISNTLSEPVVELSLGIADANYAENQFTMVTTRMRYAGESLEIDELKFEEGEEHWFALSGMTDMRFPSGKSGERFLAKEDSIDFRLELNSVNLSNYARYNPFSQEITGIASGIISATGTYINPRMEFEINGSDGRFDQVEFVEVSGKGTYSDSVLNFTELHGTSESGEYSGYGYLPANLALWRIKGRVGNDPIDMRFAGRGSDMYFLAEYLNEVEAIKGEFEYDLRIHGRYREQIREGAFTVRNGQVDTNLLQNSPTGIEGKLVIENNVGRIMELTGTMPSVERAGIFDKAFDTAGNVLSGIGGLFGGGDKETKASIFSVEGTMDFAQFFRPRFDLVLEGSGLYVLSLLGEVEAVTDASLRVTGKDTLTISGELMPDRVIIRQEFVEELEDEVREETRPYLVYNIHVVMPGEFFLKNTQADIEFSGDIWIIKVPREAYNFSGSVSAIKGKFFYLNDTFNIERAEVGFDPFVFNPTFDVLATTEIGAGESKVKIFVEMGGTLEKPTYLFTSEPEYSETDILTLINFKQTGEALALGTGQIGTASVGYIMTNWIERSLANYGSELVGFDTFELKPGEASFQGLESTEILMGRRITSSFYLTYQRRLRLANPGQRVGVEYKLNRNMSLAGNMDNEGLIHVNYVIKYVY